MPNQFPAQPTSTKEMIKARIAEYDNRANNAIITEQQNAKEVRKQNAIHETIYKNREERTSRYQKFTAFTEKTRDMLFEHVMFTLCSGALKKVDEKRGSHIMENYDSTTALHSMIYKFIHENGGSSHLLGNMRINGGTYYIESMHSLIQKTFKTIIESIEDKGDPDSFKIDNDITDAFKKSVASEDTDVMSDAISDRVVAAIGEFIEGNVKDKEAITAALERTKNKIESIEDDREGLKESYARLGKKYITEVRNRKHGLFNEMVTMLTKEVVNNKSLHENYMNGAHVDIAKIVEKTTLMYGFLETVNTMKLIKITPEYIKEHVLSL